MLLSSDAYPEMIIARARDEIRELDRQQRASRDRSARRRRRMNRLLLKWHG
jgi:hypothetical protein